MQEKKGPYLSLWLERATLLACRAEVMLLRLCGQGARPVGLGRCRGPGVAATWRNAAARGSTAAWGSAQRRTHVAREAPLPGDRATASQRGRKPGGGEVHIYFGVHGSGYSYDGLGWQLWWLWFRPGWTFFEAKIISPSPVRKLLQAQNLGLSPVRKNRAGLPMNRSNLTDLHFF